MLILRQVILERFGVLKCKAYFGMNRVSLFFFKILYCIFHCSYDIFIRQFLEVIEKLRPFARRLVSIWVNCLEDILITHFFLSAILVPLWVTLFLLINSQHFHICLFSMKSKLKNYTSQWLKKLKEGKYDNCVIKVLKLELVIESGLLNTRKLPAKLKPEIGQEKYSLLIPS